MNEIFKNTPVTIVLILINVAVYIVMCLVPDSIYYLAMYTPYVFKGAIWWTPFTSLFAHSGLAHIAMNMLSLWFLGSVIEPVFGSKKFTILYFISGMAGSLFSILFDVIFHTDYLYLGASGAIFGLFAAYGMLLLESYRLEKAAGDDISNLKALKSSLTGFAVLLIINIGFSLTPGIGWQAHLGGFIAGGIVSAIMLNQHKKNK